MTRVTFEAEIDGPLTAVEIPADAPRIKIGTREYVRDDAGTWVYADSGVPVPGAVDRTLARLVKPAKMVAEGRVEKVVIGIEAVEAYPDELAWCTEIGWALSEVQSGETRAYAVPVQEWEARADELLGLIAPELTDDEDERALAEIERQVRLATAWQRKAVAQRARLLGEVSSRGMTRRKAAFITGLSAARIQQLVDERPPELGPDHVALLRRLAKGGQPKPYAALGGKDKVRPLMKVLSDHDYVALGPGGWQPTESGLEWMGQQVDV